MLNRDDSDPSHSFPSGIIEALKPIKETKRNKTKIQVLHFTCPLYSLFYGLVRILSNSDF